ncbi:MAG: ribonucleotide reductase, partial [Gammaproteobacteria bacterium TMED104]
MLNDLFPHPLIARTGRIDSWIKNPDGRLPVSCTVFVVDDSIEGDNGIEASWRFVSHALRYGAGVAVHLSKIRPNGHTNEKGLVASGPVSFGKVYSALNETIRRGGVYKNGACVLHLDLDHADILEFITTPRSELPWVKRCVDLTPKMWKDTPYKKELLEGIKSGDIWLNKIKYQYNERIYSNVCLEVYLPSRGTCLLQHVNLAACSIGNIQEGFVTAMSELCDLHARTGVGESGEYLASSLDRQVGLGMLGLANLLRRHGVTYKEFGEALDRVNFGLIPQEGTAAKLAFGIKRGILAASDVAREHGMDRAFAIAPTASCSYNSKDLDGFTACPEIAPPIARSVDRDSGTFGVTSYDYGEVEIASEVGWDAYKRVADGIMTMLNKTGL